MGMMYHFCENPFSALNLSKTHLAKELDILPNRNVRSYIHYLLSSLRTICVSTVYDF